MKVQDEVFPWKFYSNKLPATGTQTSTQEQKIKSNEYYQTIHFFLLVFFIYSFFLFTLYKWMYINVTDHKELMQFWR